MIISTAGSRVINRERNEVRRRTLLEIAKEDDDDGSSEIVSRRRAMSEAHPVIARDIKMKHMDVKKRERNEDKLKASIRRQNKSSTIKGNSFNMAGLDFWTAWINIVSERDVKEIASTQRQTIRKFEETNEMLRHFNLLSESTFLGLQKQYQSHVQLLCSLRNDLEQIFRRLRSLKEKVNGKYPEAVQATNETVKMLKERQMMEMEYEVQKYNSIDENSLPLEPHPIYSSNPDTLEGTHNFIDKENILSNVELDKNAKAAGNQENQLVPKDSSDEDEYSEIQYVVMSINNDGLESKSEAGNTVKNKDEMRSLQEGNAQCHDLRTITDSTTENLEVGETIKDTESDIRVVSGKLYRLDIKSEGVKGEIPVGSNTEECQSTESSIQCKNEKAFDSNGKSSQNTQKLTTQENIPESELYTTNDHSKEQEKEDIAIALS